MKALPTLHYSATPSLQAVEDDSKSLSGESKAETDPLRSSRNPDSRSNPAGHR
jgi:hypothetical protein